MWRRRNPHPAFNDGLTSVLSLYAIGGCFNARRRFWQEELPRGPRLLWLPWSPRLSPHFYLAAVSARMTQRSRIEIARCREHFMVSFMSRGIMLVLGVAALLMAGRAWLEWNDEDNTRSMDRILSPEQLRALPAPQEAKRPLLVQLDNEQFALVNPTRFPIHYVGYRIHGLTNRPPRGDIQPLYQAEILDENGQWQRNGLRWCRTGADTFTVRPGQAGRFRVRNASEGRSARISLTYWEDPQAADTIWSEPIRQ